MRGVKEANDSLGEQLAPIQKQLNNRGRIYVGQGAKLEFNNLGE